MVNTEEDNRTKSKSAQHRRMQIIETVLTTSGKVRTRDLAQRFDIGQNLLANDINYLVDLGQLVRGHGWVMRRTTSVSDLFVGTEFAARQSRNIEEKQAIAKYITREIEDGAQALLDAGSTALELGMALAQSKKNVEIITNNMPLILHFVTDSTLPSCRLIGGKYDRERAATTGAEAAKMIEAMTVDVAVLTPRAISMVDQATAQAISLPTGAAVSEKIGLIAQKVNLNEADVAERGLYFNLYSNSPSQDMYKGTLVKNASQLFIALDHHKISTGGKHFFTVIVNDLATEANSRELEKPLLAPVRTRGSILVRRVKDKNVDLPVDFRGAESIKIVTTTEEGGNPPAELVRLLLQLRNEPRFEQLMNLAKEILIVVDRSSYPIPDDWIDRFVLA
ncbi:DeoR/GlpR transcriptional regulator [Candidatus Bipolaricaulota bacterium]|nr:DeoR/GlpR transcriptional regulator [Candidatus Bipolaricaulota bacterium]